MRLIHTSTLELVEFLDSDIPAYAILSHCWGNDEVSLQEFQDGKKKEGSGHAKIVDCCRLAREREIEWAWVDTCCIDKSSSAELSEAINSMFRWYEDSIVCFAFLSDLLVGDDSFKLSKCRWFSRGFTLQELLAPRKLVFFDCNLSEIGTRSALAHQIAPFTKISTKYLLRRNLVSQASVAQRMSWAAERATSRPEDIAYCLLGLFDANMPLLYGEGEKRAFLRLQHQIVAESTDESIFAWRSSGIGKRRGMLANTPSEFADCQHIQCTPFDVSRPPYTLTGKGVEFSVVAGFAPYWLVPILPTMSHTSVVQLECKFSEPRTPLRSVSIQLQRSSDSKRSWFRADPSKLLLEPCTIGTPGSHGLGSLIHGFSRIFIPHPETLGYYDVHPLPENDELRSYGVISYDEGEHSLTLEDILKVVQKAVWVFSFLGIPVSVNRKTDLVLLWLYLAVGWRLLQNCYWFFVSVLVALLLSGESAILGLLADVLLVGVCFQAHRFADAMELADTGSDNIVQDEDEEDEEEEKEEDVLV